MSPMSPLPSPPRMGPGARTATGFAVGCLSIPVVPPAFAAGLGRARARLTVRTFAMIGTVMGPTSEVGVAPECTEPRKPEGLRGPATGVAYFLTSNRSAFITLFHAATKSLTNFSLESFSP